jgi:ferredoxin
MSLIIEKNQVKGWLAGLKKNFIVIETKKMVLPAKQYFFPPKEDIFIFNKISGKLSVPEKRGKLLLVCSHLGELEAMTQLDEIMKTPRPDWYYWQKRDQSVLVGIVDQSVEAAPGADLILEKINKEQYRALILTAQGKKLVKKDFFKEIKKPKIKKYLPESKPLKELLLDPELLSEAVAWSWPAKHKIWDELGKKCLGCGICTYVCPICHCFSIEDRVDLDGEKCVRCRQWDACTLPKFAQVAGGHNFHKSIKERYYNWFYHKFVRAYKEYGRAQCVACGQCARHCPAGISIEKVLLEIVGDYKKK